MTKKQAKNTARTTSPTKPSLEKSESKTKAQNTLAHHVSQSFAGPLPPPDVLAKYDELHPGLAERIVGMAEREQGHRHQCELGALNQELRNHEARNREAFRGQLFGFLIGSIAIVAGSNTAALGAQWPGGFIGGGGVIGLVAVFILGRRNPERKHPATKKAAKT